MKRAAGRRQIEQVISEGSSEANCRGKRCYPSQADAAKLAKRARRQQDHRVEAYHCTGCHAWHIGGIQPKQKILNAKRRARHDQARSDQ